jgi:hypothetical protein
MKLLVVLCLVLNISNLLAKTEFSKTIEYVQKTYADKYIKHPILIFDMDELELRYMKADAFGDSKELEWKRARIIQKYVKDKIGLNISEKNAFSYEVYTTLLKNGAYAVPMNESYGEKEYLMCAVFPASINSNERLETERLLGLTTKGAYKDISFDNLKETLSLEEMKLFSLYHELAHCMDGKFLPEARAAYEPGAHDIHEAESFAEVMALFFLEREGIHGTGKIRANYRNLYTQEMGRWFIDNERLSFGDALFAKGGLIYWLVPSLLAADEFVTNERDFVRYKGVDALLNQALYIVENNRFEHRSFHAAFQYMKRGKDALDNYKELSESSPDLFLTAYNELLEFIGINGPMAEGFLVTTPAPLVEDDESKLDIEKVCDHFDLSSDDKLWEQIDTLRYKLEHFSKNAYVEKQREYKTHLDDLYAKLSKCENL